MSIRIAHSCWAVAGALAAVCALLGACAPLPATWDLIGCGDCRGAELRVVPTIAAGGYRTQAVVTPYASSDVDHVLVALFVLDGQTEKAATGSDDTAIAQDVASESLGLPIKFEGLHHDTTYRLRGYAYSKPGTASADLVSIDAESFTDIAVARDDTPSAATLSVQLIDRPFNGQGTASLELRPGGIADSGFEEIE